jgi:hypothetical protein
LIECVGTLIGSAEPAIECVGTPDRISGTVIGCVGTLIGSRRNQRSNAVGTLIGSGRNTHCDAGFEANDPETLLTREPEHDDAAELQTVQIAQAQRDGIEQLVNTHLELGLPLPWRSLIRQLLAFRGDGDRRAADKFVDFVSAQLDGPAPACEGRPPAWAKFVSNQAALGRARMAKALTTKLFALCKVEAAPDEAARKRADRALKNEADAAWVAAEPHSSNVSEWRADAAADHRRRAFARPELPRADFA